MPARYRSVRFDFDNPTCRNRAKGCTNPSAGPHQACEECQIRVRLEAATLQDYLRVEAMARRLRHAPPGPWAPRNYP